MKRFICIQLDLGDPNDFAIIDVKTERLICRGMTRVTAQNIAELLFVDAVIDPTAEKVPPYDPS